MPPRRTPRALEPVAKDLFAPILKARPSRTGWRVLSWDAEQGLCITLARGDDALLIEFEDRDDDRDCYARTERFNVCARHMFDHHRSLSGDEHRLVRSIVRVVDAREHRLPELDRPQTGRKADVREILTKLTIEGIIGFDSEPASDGSFSEEDTEHIWDTVVVRWRLGLICDPDDPQCGLMRFVLSNLTNTPDPVAGSFSGAITEQQGRWFLTIDPHVLEVQLGAMINALIENVLLGLITGELQLRTYEQFIGLLLGGDEPDGTPCFRAAPGVVGSCCARFANDIAGSSASFLEGLARSACDSLIQLGGGFIRDQITNISLGGGNLFTLRTAPMRPCELQTSSDGLRFEAFGLGAAPCLWSVDVDVAGAMVTTEAEFFGELLQ